MHADEFEEKLMYAECLFRDEIVRRMALLKVHDDSIFKQVKQEIEVDFA
jgi:hypothetical protein